MPQSPAAAPLPPVPDSAPAWEQYLEKNFNKLLLLCAAIVLGLLLYGITQYSSHARAVEAGGAFAAAKTVEDCDLVIQKYSGTLAAGNALLLKADLLWEQNKKDTSVSALRDFVKSYDDHPFLPQTLLALASKLEALGERAEAKPLYERLVSEFATTDAAPLAQLRLGDVLWAEGKEDEAKAIYETLPQRFPGTDSAILNQGEKRAQWIAAKLPTIEVDGPPKPKVETPAATPPGAPQINLNSGAGTLSPTLMPQAGGVTTPVINLGGGKPADAAAPAPPLMPSAVSPVVPAPVTPTPAIIPAPANPVSPVPPPAPTPITVPAPPPTAPANIPAPAPAAPPAKAP